MSDRMTYQVEVGFEPERRAVVAKGVASFEQLPTEIRRLLDLVYDSLKGSGVRPGKNIVLYDEHLDQMQIEAGVELTEKLDSGGAVSSSVIPSGPVAKTTHVGPYSDLHHAHLAIRQWCSENDRKLAGPNWEIYSHWNDDESKLKTDVYYLLR